MMTLAGWMTLDGLYYKKQLGTLHKKSKCALENVETVENNITVITPVVTVFLFFSILHPPTPSEITGMMSRHLPVTPPCHDIFKTLSNILANRLTIPLALVKRKLKTCRTSITLSKKLKGDSMTIFLSFLRILPKPQAVQG